jgi:RHS repeat-associated protein
MHVATYVNNTTYFSHNDWLGTSRALTDPTGTVIETCANLAFGDGQSCTGTNWSPLHYTGLEQDAEDGLTHTLFRQLSTTQGRWMTPDPAGMAAADPTNPQSWNRYAYALNSPLGLVDLLGLATGGPGGGDPDPPPFQYPCPFNPDLGYGTGGLGCFFTPNPSCAPIYNDGEFQGSPCIMGIVVDGSRSSSSAANNSQPKSPARQQCEKNAQQKYANAKAAVPGIVARGAAVGAGVAVTGQALAGCALGTGAGTILGGLATSFLGGEGAFAGAPVGCFTGGVSAVLEGLPQTAVYAVAGGGLAYLWENHVANSEYQQDMQACSQIQ